VIVLDASVWVSLLLADDAHNQETTFWIANQLEKQQVFAVPSIFAVEVGGAVRRRTGNAEDARRAVNRIHRDPYFHITDLDMRFAAIAAGTAIQFALKGADAIYVALAQRLKLPLVTWDNEQLERAGQIIEVMTPDQALERLD
jgi:predicted nucleic acid-binding protein